MPTQLMSHLHPTHTHHLHDQVISDYFLSDNVCIYLHTLINIYAYVYKNYAQQTTQQNLTEQADPELARLHRDGACPFVAAAQKAKALCTSESVIKLEDGTHIPLDDAFEIFRSISFDDTVDGKYLKKIFFYFFSQFFAYQIVYYFH